MVSTKLHLPRLRQIVHRSMKKNVTLDDGEWWVVVNSLHVRKHLVLRLLESCVDPALRETHEMELEAVESILCKLRA